LFLKTKDERKKGAYKLYTPPFILAPTKQKVSEGVEWLGGIQGHTIGGMVSSGSGLSVGPGFSPQSSVLYVAYCISEDHRWLLASATDDRGELLETTIISIYIPNRSKRRKASARKHGLQKLMDFILGIMSTGVQPWRLVVGRLGRVGHGELESWSSLLSRKSLLRASNQLKESCRQCNLQFPGDSPCVLSACLVSLEPDSCLRLMPDQFTPDERFGVSVSAGSSSTLSTPQDISCTHILVFPTSATTQSSQTAFQDQHINGPDLGDEDLFLINVSDVNDMGDGIDGMQDLQLGDIFGSWEDNAPGVPSPVGSPRRDSTSQPGSPGGVGASGRQSPFQSGGQGRSSGRGDTSDDLGTVLQQPLALGYLVSTAPAGQLPSWFWASCPQRSVEKKQWSFPEVRPSFAFS
jgi:mediator of RNA polymerase II transcription subunit 13